MNRKIEQDRAQLLSNRHREPVIVSAEHIMPRSNFSAQKESNKELDLLQMRQEMKQRDIGIDGQNVFKIYDNDSEFSFKAARGSKRLKAPPIIK